MCQKWKLSERTPTQSLNMKRKNKLFRPLFVICFKKLECEKLKHLNELNMLMVSLNLKEQALKLPHMLLQRQAVALKDKTEMQHLGLQLN